MALKLGDLVAYLKTDNKQLIAGLAAGRAEFRAAGAGMEKDADATGRAIGVAIGAGGINGIERLSRDTLGRLHDERGRYVSEGSLLGSTFGRAAGDAARFGLGGLISGLGDLGKKAIGATSSMWGLIPIIAGVIAAAIAGVPALYLLGGALGALPALAVGAGAGVGALVLGFMGLGDAFKQSAASGGAAVDRAYQVAQASRRVRDATEEETAATVALNRARLDQVETLQDLSRELHNAETDAGAAALGVIAAQRDLQSALAKGDPFEVAQARVRLQQANDAVADAQDRLEDLTAQQREAAAAGVEGSDQVQQALKRQRDATEAVADAHHQLAEAQKGTAGGGVLAQATKLAPAATELVAAIKSLKPAFEDWRLDTQQRLLTGWGDEIRSLGSTWIPVLQRRTGAMADVFNSLFKLFSANIKRPEFIANIETGMESVERLIMRIGSALAGPFTDAFGRLSAKAAPFVDALGDELGGMVDHFAAWIEAADNSGSLEDFFTKATQFLHDFWDIGGDVLSIAGSLIAILFGAPRAETEGPFATVKRQLDHISEWLKDPENQKKVDEWLHKLDEFLKWWVTKFMPQSADLISHVSGWIRKVDEWGDAFDTWRNRVSSAVGSVLGTIAGMRGRVDAAAAGLWDGFAGGFRYVMNKIIGWWNGLAFSIPTFNAFGVHISGGTVSTPDIPYLKDGGVVPATPGGRLIVAGEGGQDEIVAPEDKLRRILTEVLGSGLGGVLTIAVETRGLQRDQKRRIRWKGGSAQLVLGTDG